MRRQIIQTESAQFGRDVSTMALINTDESAYFQYKSQRAKSQTVAQLSTDVIALKDDMEQIKRMLTQITKAITNGES
jgi:hypothetical protein|tara:strand:+ start:15456 stop:15686 length:231 start_codon:yes stop_codon:yes gene_type:complete